MDFIGLLIRNVFFSLMEIFKGNTIRKKLRILSQNSRDSQEKIEDVQREELKKLLLYCIEHVPAYKRYDYLKKEIESCPEKALKEFPSWRKKSFQKTEIFSCQKKQIFQSAS